MMVAELLPVNLRLEGRLCVVVGAGAVGWKKARKLAAAGARLRVIAPAYDPPTSSWQALGAELVVGSYVSPDDLGHPFLVVAATNQPGVNAAVACDARALGALVLRTDAPEEGDLAFMATVRRGRLSVNYATDGGMPLFSARLRELGEHDYDQAFGTLCELLVRLSEDEQWRALSEGRRRELLGEGLVHRLLRLVRREGEERAYEELLDRLRNAKGEATRRLGSVALVGAGPGDPELLTLKGAQLLREADVVVHDALVLPELLERHAPSARHINAGKHKGAIVMSQADINLLLLTLAQDGYSVVRLKGGDPCLFGRAAEELAALETAGVPCTLVSGVSSLTAVPAAAEIVVTDRDSGRSLGAFSLHKRDGRGVEGSEWRRMATGPDTLVLFMGRSVVDEACARLIEYGRSPETPAALIVNGTRPNQEIAVGSLSTLPTKARGLVTAGPGLLVVGEVVGLAAADSQAAKHHSFSGRA